MRSSSKAGPETGFVLAVLDVSFQSMNPPLLLVFVWKLKELLMEPFI